MSDPQTTNFGKSLNEFNLFKIRQGIAQTLRWWLKREMKAQCLIYDGSINRIEITSEPHSHNNIKIKWLGVVYKINIEIEE